jgi:30S ribosomal protein S31
MGRGDKKTKKGKIFRGSFGKTRPSSPVQAKRAKAKKKAAKKPD